MTIVGVVGVEGMISRCPGQSKNKPHMRPHEFPEFLMQDGVTYDHFAVSGYNKAAKELEAKIAEELKKWRLWSAAITVLVSTTQKPLRI